MSNPVTVRMCSVEEVNEQAQKLSEGLLVMLNEQRPALLALALAVMGYCKAVPVFGTMMRMLLDDEDPRLVFDLFSTETPADTFGGEGGES